MRKITPLITAGARVNFNFWIFAFYPEGLFIFGQGIDPGGLYDPPALEDVRFTGSLICDTLIL